MTRAAPAVSVLMGVRQGARWVRGAVESLRAQTDPDWELVVVDDGSTDGTLATIEAIADPRVRAERQEPAGLTAALVRAAARARAPLLARLDADDLARPERLGRQRAFLAAHPDVGLLGTAAVEVDAEGRAVARVSPPADDAAIRRALIRRNPFVHSSVMMRREVFERAGAYDLAFPVAQDYDLWMRMSALTRLANLPEALVVRRLVPGRVSAVREDERLVAEARIRWRAVRAGVYPAWCLAFAGRSLIAHGLPVAARRLLRALVPGGGPRP